VPTDDVGEIKEGFWRKKIPKVNTGQKVWPLFYSVIIEKFLAFDVI